jgi:capsular polysaccharide biosynthesis protein
VLDPAPKPTKPIKSRRRLVMLGLGASAVLGVLLMLVCGLLDDRLFDRVDIERLELAPLLVVVPKLPPPGRQALLAQRRAAQGRGG